MTAIIMSVAYNEKYAEIAVQRCTVNLCMLYIVKLFSKGACQQVHYYERFESPCFSLTIAAAVTC